MDGGGGQQGGRGEVAVPGGKANIPQQAVLIQHLVHVHNMKKRHAQSACALQGGIFFLLKAESKPDEPRPD